MTVHRTFSRDDQISRLHQIVKFHQVKEHINPRSNAAVEEAGYASARSAGSAAARQGIDLRALLFKESGHNTKPGIQTLHFIGVGTLLRSKDISRAVSAVQGIFNVAQRLNARSILLKKEPVEPNALHQMKRFTHREEGLPLSVEELGAERRRHAAAHIGRGRAA